MTNLVIVQFVFPYNNCDYVKGVLFLQRPGELLGDLLATANQDARADIAKTLGIDPQLLPVSSVKKLQVVPNECAGAPTFTDQKVKDIDGLVTQLERLVAANGRTNTHDGHRIVKAINAVSDKIIDLANAIETPTGDPTAS